MSDRVLILRTCNADMTSRGKFTYPESGWVEAPDWDGGLDVCGGGLHGFRWGCGSGQLANWDSDAKWLVIAADASDVADVTADNGGKCKFRGGIVVCCGDRKVATDYLIANGAAGMPVIGSTLTGGDRSTLTGGDRSTLTGGYLSTLTGGDLSTLTGGRDSTLTGGYRSTLTVKHWDCEAAQSRIAVAYVGEGGIKPNTPYRYDVAKGEFVEAECGGASDERQ